MKSFLKVSIAALFCLLVNSDFAQNTMSSPRDSLRVRIDGANITINYGSPAVNGREIWGKLVPYDRVWRTGANEATTFESDRDIMIGEEKLPAGKYSFFTRPGRQEWELIFNRHWHQWGAFEYDPKEDALRMKVTPEASDSLRERLMFSASDDRIYLEWEKLKVKIPVNAAQD